MLVHPELSFDVTFEESPESGEPQKEGISK